AFILLGYTLITLVVAFGLGGPPETAEELYQMLQTNRFIGLLRLDILTVFAMPFYYLVFAGIYAPLRKTKSAYTAFVTVFAFIGLTLFLTTPSLFSLLYLSDQYTAASSEAQKTILLTAGQVAMATDMWHATATVLGGILLQSAAVLISIIMLKCDAFGKLIAYTGIVANGFDLVHIFVGFYDAEISVYCMMIAGPVYLLWFPLVGRRLWQLGKISGGKK
ncbi:hypothetical protein JW935_17100, partial [candidate division KSB1 bacterium]|nr:hypothetical protein [candidate division KSB1 bacterium]